MITLRRCVTTVTAACLAASVLADDVRRSAVPVIAAEAERDRAVQRERSVAESVRAPSMPAAAHAAIAGTVPIHRADASPAALGATVGYDVATAVVTVDALAVVDLASVPRMRPGHAGGAWSEPPAAPGETSETDNGGSGFGPDWRMKRRGKPHKKRWRAHCRIITQWNDDFFTQGSGVLIDPFHVLTAGHIVHEGDGGRFARRAFVVPAYDGDGGRWGVARSARLVAFDGWTEHGDLRHDVGLIRLKRPIGAITGWHGFATEDRCRFFEDRHWDNAGYPAEDPFDGRFLYSRSGELRDCSGRQLTLPTASYGGQSGSAVYLDGNDDVTYAVITSRNSDNSRSFAARLTGDKFRRIERKIDARRPRRYDLMPLDVRAERDARRGRRLEDFSYLVHNYSDEIFDGRVRVDVVLSENDVITDEDRIIQDHTFRARIRPLDSVRITARPRIPRGTSTGTHYLGVILHKNDDDRSNNIATGDDAHRLTVRGSAPVPPAGESRVQLVVALRAWAAGRASADIDRDGRVDEQDLLAILGAGHDRGRTIRR